MRRPAVVLFAVAWTAVAGSGQGDGEALFRECEFKAAAHAFAHALRDDPCNARLHFWLGRSYARMAEVSGPFTARRNARNAQAHPIEAAGEDGSRHNSMNHEPHDLARTQVRAHPSGR